jgi:hypothetical protein
VPWATGPEHDQLPHHFARAGLHNYVQFGLLPAVGSGQVPVRQDQLHCRSLEAGRLWRGFMHAQPAPQMPVDVHPGMSLLHVVFAQNTQMGAYYAQYWP